MHFVHISSSHGSKTIYALVFASEFLCAVLFITYACNEFFKESGMHSGRRFHYPNCRHCVWLSSSKSLSVDWLDAAKAVWGEYGGQWTWAQNNQIYDWLHEELQNLEYINISSFFAPHVCFDVIIQMALKEGMGRVCICNPYCQVTKVTKQVRDWWTKAWALCSKKFTCRAKEAWVCAISPFYHHGSYPKSGLMAWLRYVFELRLEMVQ